MMLVRKNADGTLARLPDSLDVDLGGGKTVAWDALVQASARERGEAGISAVDFPALPPGKGIRALSFAETDGKVEISRVDLFDLPVMPLDRQGLMAALDEAGLFDAFAGELAKRPALELRLRYGARIMSDDAGLRAALAAVGFDPDRLLARQVA